MKILTVCRHGSGSSLIFEKNVDKILGDLGRCRCEVCDLGSAKGNPSRFKFFNNGF